MQCDTKWPQCRHVLQKGVVFLETEGTYQMRLPKRVHSFPDLEATVLRIDPCLVSWNVMLNVPCEVSVEHMGKM